jgi:uncharacterized protein (DUF697 family)
LAVVSDTVESPIDPIDSSSVGRNLIAENMIKDHVMASVAASVVPVPLVDIAAVVGIQLRMIKKLSDLYGKPFSEKAARNILTAFVGGFTGYGAGVVVAVSLTKLIPGVGWMMGMASLPVVAGGSTYAVGQVFVRHYETDGDIFDLSTEAMRSYYKSQFAKGKEMASKFKSKKQTATPEEEASAAG